MEIDNAKKRKELNGAREENPKAENKRKRKEEEDAKLDMNSSKAMSSDTATATTKANEDNGDKSKKGDETHEQHVEATFDDDKWDWIEEFANVGTGKVTFIGPYIQQDEDLFGSEMVGEGEAIAIWQIMKALQKMGYLCPHMAIPADFDPVNYEDLFDEADIERLKSLPLGVAYLMLRDDPQKEINIHDSQGIYTGKISHFGVPSSSTSSNSTWLRVYCNADSQLGREFIPKLEELDADTNEFGFATFTHNKEDITGEKYLTTENQYVKEKGLRLFAETGLIENALATMFLVQKGEDPIAKALVNYRNSAMSTGGPNILQIEVAEEWQKLDIMSWLMVCIEDFYVHKFSRSLRNNPELLQLTTGNIDGPPSYSYEGEEQDFFSSHGYDGHGSEMSKPLMFKLVKHDLKMSLDDLASKPLPPPRSERPTDPRLAFVSVRASALAEKIADSVPDKVLPQLAVELTRAAMDPMIPEINKPPALFTKSRKAHTREVSKSIAEAVVEALPKDRSRGSSSDGSNSSKPGKTAVVEEVSDALVRKMVEAIPEKRELAVAMVEASSELDIQYDTIEKAKAVVATASEEGSTSSAEREESEEVKKKKEDLVEAVVEALPDAEVDIDNIASNIDEKELAEVSIVKETSAGMGLSGALADAVTKVIPDRALPEVAVAMTQAVLQEIPDTEAMDSKYSVPTATERGPGALANSVLNVVPDKIVPEVAVALTEAVMDAVPEDALGGKKLENPVPDAPSASEVLAETVLKSVPNELVSEVAVALTKKVIGKIPEKDMSVSSTCGSKGSRK